MPEGLHRYYGRGDFHFITFSCYERRPFLGTALARNLFVKELAHVRAEFGFLLLGYVVMPEHVHLLLSEPVTGTLSTALQMLKQCASRKVHKQKNVSEKNVRSFWQTRFYDFNVYSRGKIKEKLNYMYANPVIRKLVAHPKDWPWSSWSHYAKGEIGLITIDDAN